MMQESDFKTKQDFLNHKKNLKKTTVAILRKSRVNTVNEIIKEIAGRGRKFFYNEGLIAEIAVVNGRFYYKAEYGEIKMINLSTPDYRKPKGWFHGGSLLALVKEFREYIKDGHPREYSGLYSSHWGYPEKEMEAIREKSVQLGYLLRK
jgi:hypothetical protein